MKKGIYVVFVLGVFGACQNKKIEKEETKLTHLVNAEGTEIVFTNSHNTSFFQTEDVNVQLTQADFTAVGVVGATVHLSNSGASNPIILFENPDLTSNYTEMIQHQTNIRQLQDVIIRQKQTELERTKDLLEHGSATGQELLNAELELSMEETNLVTERAALMKHETVLRGAGFDVEILRRATAGVAFVMSDIPESLIGNIEENGSSILAFTAFPNVKFTGKIRAIADRVNPATRMVKILIEMNNSGNKIKSGMFTSSTFLLKKSNFITVSKNALITVQGRYYVFIKTNHNTFERRNVQTGQQIGERVIIYHGLESGDEVVIKGAMQLKGLSFGY